MIDKASYYCCFLSNIIGDYVYLLVGFAVNLAVALAKKCQLKVGLLDADVYGPSVPTMMKINEKPGVTEGNILILLGA